VLDGNNELRGEGEERKGVVLDTSTDSLSRVSKSE
jgi:hypothetical protein